MMKSKKTKKKKKFYAIKIFLKNKRACFCEIEVPDETFLKSFYEEVNSKKEYEVVYYHLVIFRKEDFDYAIIVQK